MAGFDIDRVLERLAEERPIFHSEADFQFALAWQINEMTPNAGVRLEWPFSLDGANRHLDIRLRTPGIAIELKYRTSRASVALDGEQFSLKNQAAQNHGRYDFIEDIGRIERMAAEHPTEDRRGPTRGYAVLLTNDHLYWKKGGNGTNDEEFRIHGDQTLTGTMTWAKETKPTKQRKQPLTLSGSYELHWKRYSRLPTENGEFRYLAVDIG